MVLTIQQAYIDLQLSLESEYLDLWIEWIDNSWNYHDTYYVSLLYIAIEDQIRNILIGNVAHENTLWKNSDTDILVYFFDWGDSEFLKLYNTKASVDIILALGDLNAHIWERKKSNGSIS